MGGANETMVAEAPIKKSGSTTLGDIRIHESQGEVHFHADSKKLKVAVPSAVWYKAWDKLSQESATWRFFDQKRSATLLVVTDITIDSMDAHIYIDKAKVGDTFKALQKFTTGK